MIEYKWFLKSLLQGLFLFILIIKDLTQKRLTFKKDERLKSRKLIEQLFKEGKSFSSGPIRIIYLFRDSDVPVQSGVTVSSKNFKKAVDRNRIKRLLREAYRLQKNDLKELLQSRNISLAIFFIYTGIQIPEYNDVFKKVGDILTRLQKVMNEKSVSNS